MGHIANRKSLLFSERGRLSQAIPQFHLEWILHQWSPIARFEPRQNERRVCADYFDVFWTEVRRPTNASDSNRSENSPQWFCDNYRAVSPI